MKNNFLSNLMFSHKLVALLLFMLLCNNVFSATKTWTVVAGGSWATGTNWSPNGAPAANDDVIIPALTNATRSITNVPTITLNSLTFTGTGTSMLASSASGNVITIRNTWAIPSTYSLTIGASGARIVWTLSTTCVATIDGYCAFDAGNTNRNFTVNGTLIVNSTGIIYDPNPSGGSDFYLARGATIRTQKAQGITTVAATTTANINYNVAVSFGGSYTYSARKL